MVEKHGVIGIIFDNNGSFFFLTLHKNLPEDKAWEFLKGLTAENQDPLEAVKAQVNETLGLKYYHVKAKLSQPYMLNYGGDVVRNEVFLIETSMNTPVKLNYDPNKLNTYLWANQARTLEKLRPEHRELLEKALPDLQKLVSQ